MKFGRLLLLQIVYEWKDAYIEYNMLKKLLSPFKAVKSCLEFLNKLFKKPSILLRVSRINNSDLEKLEQFNLLFRNNLQI